MSFDYDVIVIGGGPGGYVGAVRAAQLGKKVAIIDKRETLGGTCLNIGCIPSKALLDSSELYEQLVKHSKEHGIIISNARLDLKEMIKRKDKVVADVCAGVDFLMKKNKIKRLTGFASFVDPHTLRIENENDTTNNNAKQISAQNILIATGSTTVMLHGVEIDGQRILDSTQALNLTQVPEKLVVIGAGAIGLELGSVWRRLGAEVTVVEIMPRLFPMVDQQMSSLLQRTLTQQGMQFRFNEKILNIEKMDNGLKVNLSGDKENSNIMASHVLVAAGRRPYLDNLNLSSIGVQLNERGRIIVKPHTYQTSVANVYALGDVTDGPMLAHRASDEAIAWAETLCGQAGHINYNAIPFIVYTWPEFAWVGQSEEQLREKGIPFKTGRFLFRANGRARAMEEIDGQVKIVSHAETDQVLGMHIVGPRASDLIIEGAMAIEFSAAAEDLARTIHAHPTLAEAVREAAMATGGWSIHS